MKKNGHFSYLSKADADLLDEELVARTFRAGDYLIREEEPARSLFFIESGRVGVLKKNRNESISRVRELGAGAIVGERSLFTGGVRFASVVADEPVEAYELTVDSVEKCVRKSPSFGAAFYRAVGESMAEKLRDSTAGVGELMALSRLIALGELVTGIAHEINNPLTIVRLLIGQIGEELAEEKIDRERIAGHIVSAEHAFEHVNRIMAGLKLASHNTRGEELEQVRIFEVLESTVHLFRKKIEKSGIELTLSYDSEDLVVKCRAAELSQAVLNLISNACDAVETREKDAAERWIRIEVRDGERDVEIAVTDSGPGIPEDVRRKMFEPFYSTKALGKGTGIGLSLSKRMIEGMNGELDFAEELKHTCFIVRLPKASG